MISAIEVNYVPPNQDWDFWLFRSRNCGQSWPDTFVVSDTIYDGIGPDLAVNNYGLHIVRGDGLPSDNTTEVIYNGSSDNGETWFGPIIVSDNDTIHSQWPQITAWGDSNVIISWMDYKDSHEAWTGDVFISKSTDNGHTWSTPYQLTFSHGVTGTDIYASGDTVVLCYDSYQDRVCAIYANISFDGGETWQGEQRVSDSPYYSTESSVAISNGMAHISWSDSRNNPSQTFEVYYDKNILTTGINENDKPDTPSEIGLDAYPNPFNSSVLITYNLLTEEGGEIVIFNIQGQLLRTFGMEGKEGKIEWDASDAMGNTVSSGIYFAKASNNDKTTCIKLIYLK